MIFRRGGHDRPAPGEPIGGWCESCGSAYASGAERCPDCHAPVAFAAAPPPLVASGLPDTIDVDGDPIGGWCPSCGGEFVIGIQNCPDCDVALSHEPPRVDRVDDVTAASTRHDIVEYDLSDWDPPQFREVERQLEISHIAHEWEQMVLRVPGAHEAEVDELIDAIDSADRLSFPSDQEDPVDGVVEYEVPDWTLEQCDELVAEVQRLGIEFGWDGVCLAVDGLHEVAVDAIVRRIDPSFPVS